MSALYTRFSSGLNKTTSVQLLRYRPDGRRFGPRLAKDGGRIFQSSSRDLLKMKEKRGWTDAQVENLYQKGVLTKWLAEPRMRRKIVLFDSKSGWERWKTLRCGALGVKIGMRGEVDFWGNLYPVTLIQLQDNEVLRVKGPKEHQKPSDSGYITLQVGAGLTKWKNLTRAEQGQFAALGVDPKRHIEEFRVSPNAVLEAGTKILPSHFVAGQFVDVRGVSKGHGTAGVMERHGFKGQRASHGNSLSHRAAGSIASGSTSPSRVFPGTKMAGRMGCQHVTIQNLQINVEDQILTIKGSIPGPKGSWIRIVDAVKKPHRLPPPYPTHLPLQQPNRPVPSKKYLRMRFPDPYQKQRTYDWETRWAEARIALKSAQQAAGGLLEGEEPEEQEEFVF